LTILFSFDRCFGNVTELRGKIEKEKYDSSMRLEKIFKENLSDNFTYTIVPRGLIITIDNSLLFEPKSAVLLDSAEKILSELGNTIKNLNKNCVIEGNTLIFDDSMQNMLLTIERSQNIAEFLTKNCGIDSLSIRSLGFGNINPPENNIKIFERIDIVILNY